MNFNHPNLILITSDGNKIKFVKTIKLKTGLLYQYRFIVSETKLNMLCEFSELELCKQMNGFFKEIKDL